MQDWVWVNDWKLDLSVNPKDPEGWGYALGFEAGMSIFSLGERMAGDGIRRRRWYRTRQRTDVAAIDLQEKQRRITASTKETSSGPKPQIQGWLYKVDMPDCPTPS